MSYDLYARYAVRHREAGYFMGEVGDFMFWTEGITHPKFEGPHFFPSAMDALKWLWTTWGEGTSLRDTRQLMDQFELVKDWRP